MHPLCPRLQGGQQQMCWVPQKPTVLQVVSNRTVTACTATRQGPSPMSNSRSSRSSHDTNSSTGDWGELASSQTQQSSVSNSDSSRRVRRTAVAPPQRPDTRSTATSNSRPRTIQDESDIALQTHGKSNNGGSKVVTTRIVQQPLNSNSSSSGNSVHRQQRHTASSLAGDMQQPQQRPQRSSGKSPAAAAVRSKSSKSVKKVAALPSSMQPCCYGCGAPLQTEVALGPGYVPLEKYEMKKKHKQLTKVLCARCCDLCNGAMIPAVQDFTQKAWAQQQAALIQQQPPAMHSPNNEGVGNSKSLGSADERDQQTSAHNAAESQHQSGLLGKVLVTPEELREKIMPVRSVKAVAVLLVDLLDASGTLMSKVRDLVGNNPIILVGTKMDLLPAGCHPKDVAEWLAESAIRKRLQVASCHLVSSHTGEGIAAVTAKICRERKGRDVFVVGAANVGKSAFIRAMLKEMSSLSGGNFSGAALSTSRYVPVESSMPGTTLGLIPLQAFDGGGTLFDTPGVHLHHRIPHMLTPEELKLLHPRRQLKPFIPPSPLDISTQQQQEEQEQHDQRRSKAAGVSATAVSIAGKHAFQLDDRSFEGNSSSKLKQVSASYAWGGLVRVDVVSAPPETSLVFYGPNGLKVYDQPLSAEHEEDGMPGHSSQPDRSKENLFGYQSVKARGGLFMHELAVQTGQGLTSSCIADIAVSGLPGWIAVHAPINDQKIQLRVWAPKGVEVFLRPPLPCPAPYMDSEELAALESVPAGEDWEAYREGLGLREMSAEDEDVVKMLLFGADSG